MYIVKSLASVEAARRDFLDRWPTRMLAWRRLIPGEIPAFVPRHRPPPVAASRRFGTDGRSCPPPTSLRPFGAAADAGWWCVGASRRRVDRSSYSDPEMPEFPGAVYINHIGMK